MAEIKANDGSELLNGSQFYYTKDKNGRPILNVNSESSGGGGDFMADGSIPMTGNLYMDGNAIFGVKSISDADSGMAIESELSMNNHRITDLLDPTDAQDAVTKKYLETLISAQNTAISGMQTTISSIQAAITDLEKRIDDLTTPTE